MGCKCPKIRTLARLAILPLLLLLLQGCATIAVSRAQEEASAPYCNGLYEIQAIDGAWRTASGDLLICVRGTSVGAVYSEYGSAPNAASWEETVYSISIPALENDGDMSPAQEKWRNIPLVAVSPEMTTEACPAPQTDWQPVNIEKLTSLQAKKIWWDDETAAELSRPGEAILDGYDPESTAKTYSKSFNVDQAVILRRETPDGFNSRLVAFHIQHPRGIPGFHLTILRGPAFLFDLVTLPIQLLTLGGTIDFMPLQCRNS